MNEGVHYFLRLIEPRNRAGRALSRANPRRRLGGASGAGSHGRMNSSSSSYRPSSSAIESGQRSLGSREALAELEQLRIETRSKDKKSIISRCAVTSIFDFTFHQGMRTMDKRKLKKYAAHLPL
jgi:hypothetical protein